MYGAGSKSLISPAIWMKKLLASNSVMRPMPLAPASSAFHELSTSSPTGHTRPSPVTTTLRNVISLSCPLRARAYVAASAPKNSSTASATASGRSMGGKWVIPSSIRVTAPGTSRST